jgi:hypothetical protein
MDNPTMYEQMDEQWRKQLGQMLQNIKSQVREANGRSSESEMSELELVTEQWLDLVSSFISPLSTGSSALENGQLMEMVRQAMGNSELADILQHFGQQEWQKQNSDKNQDQS